MTTTITPGSEDFRTLREAFRQYQYATVDYMYAARGPHTDLEDRLYSIIGHTHQAYVALCGMRGVCAVPYCWCADVEHHLR